MSYQSTLGESLPNETGIVTSRQDLVCHEDGVSGVLEGRTTRLQLHPVDDELHNQGIALGRHLLQRILVGVKVGNLGASGGREQALLEAVLCNEDFRNFLSPALVLVYRIWV